MRYAGSERLRRTSFGMALGFGFQFALYFRLVNWRVDEQRKYRLEALAQEKASWVDA